MTKIDDFARIQIAIDPILVRVSLNCLNQTAITHETEKSKSDSGTRIRLNLNLRVFTTNVEVEHTDDNRSS